LLLATLLDDELVEPELLCSTLKHALLYAVLSDETKDIDLLSLANAVCAIHCLQIGLGIPASR
jgi:hypothetical protein